MKKLTPKKLRKFAEEDAEMYLSFNDGSVLPGMDNLTAFAALVRGENLPFTEKLTDEKLEQFALQAKILTGIGKGSLLPTLEKLSVLATKIQEDCDPKFQKVRKIKP